MRKTHQLYLNTVSSVIFQVVSVIGNFIIPKLILEAYGSATNGLISSITQSLSFYTIADMGVGAVVLASLYKPLGTGDSRQVNKILRAGQKFFNIITAGLALYVSILAWIYTRQFQEFGVIYITTLFFSMVLPIILDFLGGRINLILLQADQKMYIAMSVNILIYIINIIVSIVLLNKGISILSYKWISTLILICYPIALKIYTRKHYYLEYISYDEDPLKQKWNGLSHHIASVVFGNTDTMVLTWGSTLENVSVYAIYSGVIRNVSYLLSAIAYSIQPYFGALYANSQTQRLRETFRVFEIYIHIGITILYGCTSILIVPFVNVYTRNIHDFDYSAPIFAFLLSIAYMVYCYRNIYHMVVLAAGHFKETQRSLWTETIMNITLSVLLVGKLGLSGVAIGTLVAMIYQAVYMSSYSAKHILERSYITFWGHIGIDAICVWGTFMICSNFKMYSVSYGGWFVLAVKTLSVCCMVTILVNTIFFGKILLKSCPILHLRK
ncbi:MAG: sugar isomerase [Lachnospiraceae bacterium]|nr:sugar isomerase [Lachnospiraceae bacterium]